MKSFMKKNGMVELPKYFENNKVMIPMFFGILFMISFSYAIQPHTQDNSKLMIHHESPATSIVDDSEELMGTAKIDEPALAIIHE